MYIFLEILEHLFVTNIVLKLSTFLTVDKQFFNLNLINCLLNVYFWIFYENIKNVKNS